MHLDRILPETKRYLLIWILFCFGAFGVTIAMATEESVSITDVSAITGGVAKLPCDMKLPGLGDKVYLIIWYKEGSASPIYSFDSRGKPLKDGKHWANEDILTGRAFFRANDDPARLMIENVKEQDAGMYRCRVDFKKSPTRNAKVNLTVIRENAFTHTLLPKGGLCGTRQPRPRAQLTLPTKNPWSDRPHLVLRGRYVQQKQSPASPPRDAVESTTDGHRPRATEKGSLSLPPSRRRSVYSPRRKTAPHQGRPITSFSSCPPLRETEERCKVRPLQHIPTKRQRTDLCREHLQDAVASTSPNHQTAPHQRKLTAPFSSRPPLSFPEGRNDVLLVSPSEASAPPEGRPNQEFPKKPSAGTTTHPN